MLFDDFGNGDEALFGKRCIFFDARHHVAGDGNVRPQALGIAQGVRQWAGGADLRGVDGAEEGKDLFEFADKPRKLLSLDFQLGEVGGFGDGCGVQLVHGD